MKTQSEIHDAIAGTLGPFGGLLRCKCGREVGLGDIAAGLAKGWPMCHGETMLWLTERQLERERGSSRDA